MSLLNLQGRSISTAKWFMVRLILKNVEEPPHVVDVSVRSQQQNWIRWWWASYFPLCFAEYWLLGCWSWSGRGETYGSSKTGALSDQVGVGIRWENTPPTACERRRWRELIQWAWCSNGQDSKGGTSINFRSVLLLSTMCHHPVQSWPSSLWSIEQDVHGGVVQTRL